MTPETGTRHETSFGRTASVPGVTFDAGLRQYMLGIYNNMAIGLLITGLVAYWAGHSQAFMEAMVSVNAQGQAGLSGLGWVVTLAPIGFVMLLGFRAMKFSAGTLRTLFFVYSAIMGLSLFSIFLAYSGASIARTFFITAGTFGAVSLYGYTTRRDLSGMGHFMLMGLFGLIIASLVGIFFKSTALQFAISVLGVVIFTGLTAWDTQKAKVMYQANAGHEATSKLSVMMALSLYMDFINMFMMLLRFFGQQRE